MASTPRITLGVTGSRSMEAGLDAAGFGDDRIQWKMRYPITRIGRGTPRSHKIPYFI